MLGFDVSINGKRLCFAGIGTDGMFNVTLMHALREGTPIPPLWLNVSGLTEGEQLKWLTGEDHKALKVGDTLQVTVVETDAVDPPLERRPADGGSPRT